MMIEIVTNVIPKETHLNLTAACIQLLGTERGP